MRLYKTNHLPAMWEVVYKKKKLHITYSRGTFTIRCGANILASKHLGVDESTMETSEARIWTEYLLSPAAIEHENN